MKGRVKILSQVITMRCVFDEYTRARKLNPARPGARLINKSQGIPTRIGRPPSALARVFDGKDPWNVVCLLIRHLNV